MRVFLVPLLADDADDEVALASAAALAGATNGALKGLFIRPDPTEALSTLVEGASPSTIRSMTRAASEGLEERSRRARTALLEAARQAGLAETDARLLEPVGDFEPTLAAHGRLVDAIALAGNVDGGGSLRRRAFQAALFHATRPVLLLHRSLSTPPAKLAVAWNGSPESSRAVQAAMPWLTAATEVHVLGSSSPRHETEAPQALATYLESHGIPATCLGLNPERGVGEELLDKTEAVGATCLIMGGYGRSRMQEMIFGGATRHVLMHRKTTVLIAH